MWWIQCLSSKNGENRAGRTIWPIVRASKIVDDNTYTFDWSSCTRKFIAKVQRTNWKVITTRQIEQILYWCRIPDYSWSRTVLHDKGHWRVLTIYRTSNMSWVHFAKRWKVIWPERLDSREHQNWARIGRNDLLRLQGKHGVEIRIKSVNKDHSHSGVRISHGLNKLVTDLSNKEDDDNEQETPETKTEEFVLKMNVLAFASRSKAEAKPRRPTSACSSTRTVPICERIWTDIEPGTQSNLAYPVAKRLNTLLRHGQLPREEDGAVELWRLKDDLRNEWEHSQHGSDEMWKSKMQGGGGNKKRFQYCTDSSG